MNIREINEVLIRHKEHFRVLPEKARTALYGLLTQLAEAIDQETKTETADVVGDRAKADTKVSKRPRRKRVE